jgi:hypothetical protein
VAIGPEFAAALIDKVRKERKGLRGAARIYLHHQTLLSLHPSPLPSEAFLEAARHPPAGPTKAINECCIEQDNFFADWRCSGDTSKALGPERCAARPIRSDVNCNSNEAHVMFVKSVCSSTPFVPMY